MVVFVSSKDCTDTTRVTVDTDTHWKPSSEDYRRLLQHKLRLEKEKRYKDQYRSNQSSNDHQKPINGEENATQHTENSCTLDSSPREYSKEEHIPVELGKTIPTKKMSFEAMKVEGEINKEDVNYQNRNRDGITQPNDITLLTVNNMQTLVSNSDGTSSDNSKEHYSRLSHNYSNRVTNIPVKTDYGTNSKMLPASRVLHSHIPGNTSISRVNQDYNLSNETPLGNTMVVNSEDTPRHSDETLKVARSKQMGYRYILPGEHSQTQHNTQVVDIRPQDHNVISCVDLSNKSDELRMGFRRYRKIPTSEGNQTRIVIPQHTSPDTAPLTRRLVSYNHPRGPATGYPRHGMLLAQDVGRHPDNTAVAGSGQVAGKQTLPSLELQPPPNHLPRVLYRTYPHHQANMGHVGPLRPEMIHRRIDGQSQPMMVDRRQAQILHMPPGSPQRRTFVGGIPPLVHRLPTESNPTLHPTRHEQPTFLYIQPSNHRAFISSNSNTIIRPPQESVQPMAARTNTQHTDISVVNHRPAQTVQATNASMITHTLVDQGHTGVRTSPEELQRRTVTGFYNHRLGDNYYNQSNIRNISLIQPPQLSTLQHSPSVEHQLSSNSESQDLESKTQQASNLSVLYHKPSGVQSDFNINRLSIPSDSRLPPEMSTFDSQTLRNNHLKSSIIKQNVTTAEIRYETKPSLIIDHSSTDKTTPELKPTQRRSSEDFRTQHLTSQERAPINTNLNTSPHIRMNSNYSQTQHMAQRILAENISPTLSALECSSVVNVRPTNSSPTIEDKSSVNLQKTRMSPLERNVRAPQFITAQQYAPGNIHMAKDLTLIDKPSRNVQQHSTNSNLRSPQSLPVIVHDLTRIHTEANTAQSNHSVGQGQEQRRSLTLPGEHPLHTNDNMNSTHTNSIVDNASINYVRPSESSALREGDSTPRHPHNPTSLESTTCEQNESAHRNSSVLILNYPSNSSPSTVPINTHASPGVSLAVTAAPSSSVFIVTTDSDNEKMYSRYYHPNSSPLLRMANVYPYAREHDNPSLYFQNDSSKRYPRERINFGLPAEESYSVPEYKMLSSSASRLPETIVSWCYTKAAVSAKPYRNVCTVEGRAVYDDPPPLVELDMGPPSLELISGESGYPETLRVPVTDTEDAASTDIGSDKDNETCISNPESADTRTMISDISNEESFNIDIEDEFIDSDDDIDVGNSYDPDPGISIGIDIEVEEDDVFDDEDDDRERIEIPSLSGDDNSNYSSVSAGDMSKGHSSGSTEIVTREGQDVPVASPFGFAQYSDTASPLSEEQRIKSERKSGDGSPVDKQEPKTTQPESTIPSGYKSSMKYRIKILNDRYFTQLYGNEPSYNVEHSMSLQTIQVSEECKKEDGNKRNCDERGSSSKLQAKKQRILYVGDDGDVEMKDSDDVVLCNDEEPPTEEMLYKGRTVGDHENVDVVTDAIGVGTSKLFDKDVENSENLGSFVSRTILVNDVSNTESSEIVEVSSDSLPGPAGVGAPTMNQYVRERRVVYVRGDGISDSPEEDAQEDVFCAADMALRCRVLVVLWALLGEARLREVGFPLEPVHRVLWRTVDICCSVAGVKSAAAVPLPQDHDCGRDMACFRDHAHRFLEVCAPTREHWKRFGWTSLTVDAVVRKMYENEILPSVPVRRFPSVPEPVRDAMAVLSALEAGGFEPRPPGSSSVALYLPLPPVQVLRLHEAALKPPPGAVSTRPSEPLPPPPVKKKRGRPAKISNKTDVGRVERVMLWRFLLNLLEDPRNAPCIHWVKRDEGIFRIHNTDWLARLWGRRHGNPKMTYEKMARAMRTYYRSKVLQPVPRSPNLPRKLVYKFNPAVIQKVAAAKLASSANSARSSNYNTNPPATSQS